MIISFITSLPENGEYDINIGIGITSGEGYSKILNSRRSSPLRGSPSPWYPWSALLTFPEPPDGLSPG
jgi:hypothetical protein